MVERWAHSRLCITYIQFWILNTHHLFSNRTCSWGWLWNGKGKSQCLAKSTAPSQEQYRKKQSRIKDACVIMQPEKKKKTFSTQQTLLSTLCFGQWEIKLWSIQHWNNLMGPTLNTSASFQQCSRLWTVRFWENLKESSQKKCRYFNYFL